MGAKARCRAQGLPNMVLVGLFGVSEEGHMTTEAAWNRALRRESKGHV